MSHTGYVYELINKNLNFKQFASTCAYAFGALVQYRDSDVDRTKLPDDVELKLEENSTLKYYEKALKEYIDKYNILKVYTKTQRVEFATTEINQNLKYNLRQLKEALKEKKIVQDMLKKVEAWEPPTDEHVNFKNFMINQLKSSQFMDDYYQEQINYYNNITPIKYYNQQIKNLKESIRNAKYRIKEERSKKPNITCSDWVKQLKESLENYEQ